MQRLHTYYDNLRVARNAPDAVIRAAYRALAQQYHPDKNPGDPEAARVMKLLNEAYAVLSDPERRSAHDQWIAKAESAEGIGSTPAPDVQPEKAASEARTERAYAASARKVSAGSKAQTPKSIWWILAFGVVLITLINLLFSKSKPAQPSTPAEFPMPAPVVSTQPPQRQSDPGIPDFDDRPPGWKANDGSLPPPAGKSWPKTASYLSGMPRIGRQGLSSITVDNTSGGFDAYVKLCPVVQGPCKGYRHVFIPNGSTFSMNNIAPGSYEVRYQNIANRQSARSPEVPLKEEVVQGGTRYSRVRLTLYQVEGGNFSFAQIPPEQF